jgi:CheY-like chemotaxis protein
VELHGGTASADSKGKGQGSTFTISLPLFATQYDENPEQERLTNQHDAVFARPVSLKGVRVLVVDDEADARELITMILEQHGAQVKAVGSAATAFKILANRSAQWRPGVLVSDIGMPNEDGYDLIRKVRALENEQGGKIPAIALTGYVKAEERVRALAEGYQKYVPKPVEPMELVAIVVSVLGKTGNMAY